MKIDLDKPKNNNSDCSEIGTINKELKDFRSKFDIAKIMQAFPDTISLQLELLFLSLSKSIFIISP